MAFVDWIERCNNADMRSFRPFLCAGQHLGWIHQSFLADLDSGVFRVSDSDVRLDPALATPGERTEALSAVTDRWIATGILSGWRGEHYRAATSLDTPELFSIERSAAPLLGLRAWGVHVNGIVRSADGIRMWVARRAADRPVAPGKWDHLIAGGLPSGMSPNENLIKEAEEEAGLPQEIARRAVAAGHVSYAFVDRSDRLRPDTLLVYDLELPADLEPHNQDGEVERFELWPLQRVAERVSDTLTFKRNCNLVIIDFLVRHGAITPEATPEYHRIVDGLRRPFPALEAARGTDGS